MGSLGAGFLGALTGLGGGVVLVPMLTLIFGVDIRYAVGASLVSVIATSSGAAAAYVREGFSNIRIGMFLEIATTLGALVGAALAARISTGGVAVIFGFVLIFSAYLSSRAKAKQRQESPADPMASHLRMDASYPTADGPVSYHVHAVPFGFSLLFVAGTLSGLLGIGSGAMKVLAMDQAMRIPFKVSTTTSNFMIGVTAAASAGVYMQTLLRDPAAGINRRDGFGGPPGAGGVRFLMADGSVRFLGDDTDPAVLKAELEKRSLVMLGAFVPVALKDKSAHEAGIGDCRRFFPAPGYREGALLWRQ